MALSAPVLYHSVTGNTRRVAQALQAGLGAVDCRVAVRSIAEGVPEDLLDFDLVCIGTPSYQFVPHRVVLDFVAAGTTDVGLHILVQLPGQISTPPLDLGLGSAMAYDLVAAGSDLSLSALVRPGPSWHARRLCSIMARRRTSASTTRGSTRE